MPSRRGPQVHRPEWAACALAALFLLIAFPFAASAQEVTLACNFDQKDCLVGAPLLMR